MSAVNSSAAQRLAVDGASVSGLTYSGPRDTLSASIILKCVMRKFALRGPELRPRPVIRRRRLNPGAQHDLALMKR
jgi:hypothetical protein